MHMSSPVEHQYNKVGDTNNQPTLPSGQVIYAKNTLQSFISPVEAMEAGVTPTVYAVPISEAAVSPVMVVNGVVAAAADDIVWHVAPDPTLNSTTDTATPIGSDVLPSSASQPYKSRNTVWILVAIVAVAVATGMGVSLAMKGQNDKSQSEDVGSENSPTSSPIGMMSNQGSTINTNLTISDVFLSYINEVKLSSNEIDLGGTSPESMALTWMIDHANATWNLSELNSSVENAMTFRVKQRFPLLAMWFQQTETRPWAHTTGWLEGAHECQWYGLSCRSMDLGGMVGSQDVITGISISGLSGYVGTLPEDIGLLSSLEYFEIIDTYDENQQDITRNFFGTLPESIGMWTALTYFNVGHNALKGSLPNAIGNWNLLNHFVICYNDLSGSLPESIGQWTALTYFYISVNTLTGSLPGATAKWTTLNHFDAGYNSLVGLFPEAIGQWISLNHFDIRANSFTATIPETMGQWTELTYFDSSYNFGLRGTLPEIIGLWTSLEVFDVSQNSLSGSIPLSIGNWSNIQTANFYANLLTGSVPDAICVYTEDGGIVQADCNSSAIVCNCCTMCY